ncbi:5-hydroxyisourate hydrolase [Bombina bombina]|uniref:5-hydroxyisourate hydrolase n=1 Tax=Bombina bombina TaxID=8345 RepID=UPI00235A7C43|nr:5-hydroxyisourate hydrolase [Bombina bombina]XP_053555349.1 5-hydroxyisourate hydrolase [Bombina bombina]
MTVTATDADDAIDTYNGVVSYSIIDQNPKEPSNQMFKINADTGLITVAATVLDYKKNPEYTLDIKATDLEGAGLGATAKDVIKITDPNDETETDMSGGTESTLTTHVLNTAQGIPAKDLTLTLSKLNAATGKWVQLSRSITNEDGRCPAILRGEPITAGTYQLRFETEEYWKKMQQESFYPYVEIAFTIKDPKQKYHIPLLLSPFSYTTYRGS